MPYVIEILPKFRNSKFSNYMIQLNVIMMLAFEYITTVPYISSWILKKFFSSREKEEPLLFQLASIACCL